MLAYLPTDQYAISLLYLILFMLFLTADRISKEEHPVSFRTANAKVALLPKNLVDFFVNFIFRTMFVLIIITFINVSGNLSVHSQAPNYH